MTRLSDRPAETDARESSGMGVGWVRLVLIFCLAVGVAGWSDNSLLIANDRVLSFFDGLLPIFDLLQRPPEHFIS